MRPLKLFWLTTSAKQSPRLIFAALIFAHVLPIAAARAGSLADEIQAQLKRPQDNAEVISGETLRMPAALDAFYAARDYKPGWVSGDGLRPSAQAMLDVLDASSEEGLNPEDYHVRALRNLFAALHGSSPSDSGRPARMATVELLLSDAFVLLAEHESHGRLDHDEFNPEGSAVPDLPNLTQRLQEAMQSSIPGSGLQGLGSQEPGYAALKAALAHYRQLAGQPASVEIPAGPPLKRGDEGPRVAVLIARLVVEGDLRAPASEEIFDDSVEGAVRRFQARHGLESDGVAGKSTLIALNTPMQAWVEQLRVNLERLRWLPRNSAATRVEVNIADYSATLYENGAATLSAPVVVGLPYRQTPEFSDMIRYLVFNPNWDVPPTIGGEEILPRIQKHSSYLKRHGYVVLRGWNGAEHQVDGSTIDWKHWTADTLPYHFRQLPGPENALGQVKFMFPNRYGVYLHDTPAQGLFAVGQRTFSHGCIRVAHALDLADNLLQIDTGGDPSEMVEKIMSSHETRQVELAHPIPIYILYLTAWVDDLGVVQFRPDIYGRDPEILHELDAPLSDHPACCATSATP